MVSSILLFDICFYIVLWFWDLFITYLVDVFRLHADENFIFLNFFLWFLSADIVLECNFCGSMKIIIKKGIHLASKISFPKIDSVPIWTDHKLSSSRKKNLNNFAALRSGIFVHIKIVLLKCKGIINIILLCYNYHLFNTNLQAYLT